MINRFIKFFSSMKFVVLLLLLFAFSIGYATFIENDFGTDSAKALIYNTWWFELLLIILGISLILNMIKHKVFRKEKLAILGFHLSFIVILDPKCLSVLILGSALNNIFKSLIALSMSLPLAIAVLLYLLP